jgi:hypothetical protein
MSSKVESADLILKLYDLRREETMRKARNWFFMFNPTTAEDIEKTMMDREVGGLLRMVLSYWDMAGAMVNQGAIDAELFRATNGEYIGVYAKIEPFIAGLREKWQMPEAFENLEKLVLDQPNGIEQVRKTQEWMKQIQAQMAEAAAA